MKPRSTVYAGVVAFVGLGSPSLAQTAGMLSFQGLIKDAGGVPITAPVNLTFQVYDAQIGGASVAGPFAQNGVMPVDGMVSTKFGPISASSFNDSPRWLEVGVNGSPLRRIEMATAPATAEQVNIPGTGTPAVSVAANGYVGIGTTDPQHLLHLASPTGGEASGIRFEVPSLANVRMFPGSAAPKDSGFLTFGDGTGWRFHFGKASDYGTTKFLTLTDQGNVDLPGVLGLFGGSLDGSVFERATIQADSENHFLFEAPVDQDGTRYNTYFSHRGDGVGGASMVIEGGGNVGIGTTNAQARLDISSGSAQPASGLRVRKHSDLTYPNQTAFEVWAGVTDVQPRYFRIYTDGGDPWNLKASFDGQFAVNGTLIASVVQITGADVAEKFPTSEAVEPGMVVEIDPDHPGQLRLSCGEYSRRVAGVVSGANGLSPGAVLGDLPGSEEHPPIAMSGRVYVWADATCGAIEAGDMLTTSATPGYAMKAADRDKAFGAVIGKAMAPLKEGKGLVLVLVQPQ